jgi:SlyX protein
MPDDIAARLDALEIRLAYQDESIEELSAALTSQWQELEKLRHQVTLLEAQLREATESALLETTPEPPPPHY